MLFSEIVGHEELKKQLIDNIKNGRVAHSQLFIGDSGYGSLALAIAYGQYLNCSNRGENDSCGVCASCYKYQNLQHPDLHFIYPINKSPYSVGSNSDGDVVSINLYHKWREIMESTPKKGYFSEQDWYKFIEMGANAQGLISKGEANSLSKLLSLKSIEGGYNVVIVWLVEQMNNTSANALLKLFEEPSDKTLFLFITHNQSKIIPTILSRTQHTYIKPVDKQSIFNNLINGGVDNNIASIAANLSNGSVIEAYRVVDKLVENSVDSNFEHFTSLMRMCFAVNHIELMNIASKLSSYTKEEIKNFLSYTVHILRNSYLANMGLQDITSNYPYENEFIAKFHPFVHHQNIELLISETERCNIELSQNVNTKIVLTHYVLAISKLIKKPI